MGEGCRCGWLGFMHDLPHCILDTDWTMVMPLHYRHNVQYICGDRPPKDSPLFVSWSDLPVWTNLLNQPAFGFWPDVLPSLPASFGSERIAQSCASWCMDTVHNTRMVVQIRQTHTSCYAQPNTIESWDGRTPCDTAPGGSGKPHRMRAPAQTIAARTYPVGRVCISRAR